MNGLKVKDSKIAGKGLFADKEFNEGSIIGIAHINNNPTGMIGKFHNHSDKPNAHSITIGNKKYLAALRPLMKGEEITVDYRKQPELEQPEDFAKGGLVKMPKPSKQGLASKKFSRSLDATNRLFTENYLFSKPKSKKRKVFDPSAKYYQDGGVISQEEIDAANNAMMKARLAYAYMHGNPAAQRMVVAPDQPYDFGNGMTGTHYMASMDNYAVPQIQDVNGQLMLGDYGPESAEAIRFDSDEDANYFAENYKDVSPAFLNQQQEGGESKKRKKDSKGRYRSEDGNIHTPLTPEMQAVMPPEEWGQYVQEVPEVYTTRTREQQEAINAAKNMELLNKMKYQGAPHLYLPDGSLRPQAIQSADWFWQLGLGAKPALEGLNTLAAAKIPYTGISLGTAANVVGGIHGATQVPQRIEDWQEVVAGNKNWKEAAAETAMTALELGAGAYEGVNALRFKPDPSMYYRGIGPEGYEDAINTGLFRQAGVDGRPRHNKVWWASNEQGFNRAKDFSPTYIAEVPRSSFPEIGDEFFGLKIPARGTKRHIPIEEGRILKKDWLRGYKEVPRELPGSPNSTIMKSGMPNPLELADAIVPNLDPLQVTTANSLLDLSPLNIIPIGKQLGTKGNAYRKFGNTMKYVQESKSLSPKGGILPRMGKQQIEAEGNWAALNEPWEKYPGTFTAEFDFKAPGSNLGYSNPSSRSGVLITDASGKTLPEVPLTDPGLSFHRRLPFSNRYVPINKQKLIDNKFQMATQGSHLQSLAEKYGYGLAYAGLLGAMGNDQAVKKYNKYTIDPVINEAKKLLEQDSKKYQEGGEPKNRKLKLRKEDYDPQNEAGYIQETPDVNVVDPTIWGKYGRKYEQEKSKEDFVNKKKKQFLALHPGLNKKEGVTMENFPENVEQNFRDAYDYNKNTAMVKGVAKEEGWNPKDRTEYVDELTPQGYRITSNSKYGSKLQPNTWSRALSGVQELGNTLVPGQPFKYNIPGLTKAEQKQMREDPTSALEIFAPANTLGQNIANYVKNTGLSTGSDYKELPGFGSGEFMPNVTDADAMALDPIQMALSIYSGAQLPALATQLPGLITKGVKSAANTAQGIYDAGTDIKGIYNAGKGSNLSFATAPEAQAARALQEAGILGKNIDPKVLGRFPGLGQSTARQALKNYNTTYRAVTPDLTNTSIDELMNMAKSGVTNFDDPVQVAQYMSTHIPFQQYGYRANPLPPGVGQDLLNTGSYPNMETAAEKLRKYGTYLTEVRPSMDFSTGDARDWFTKYYTDKPFGIDRSGKAIAKFKNEGNYLTGYKPGTIAARRDYEYWPYIGQLGQKVLEPIRTTKIQPKTFSDMVVTKELPGSPNNSFSIFPKKPKPIEGIDLSKGRASKTINPGKETYIDPKTGLKRRGNTTLLGPEWGPKYIGGYNNSKYADPALLEESMHPYLLGEDQLRLRYPWMYE